MQYSTGRAFGWLLYRSGLLGELLIVHTQLSIILYYSECSSSQWEASFKCIGTGVYFKNSFYCEPICKILKSFSLCKTFITTRVLASYLLLKSVYLHELYP